MGMLTQPAGREAGGCPTGYQAALHLPACEERPSGAVYTEEHHSGREGLLPSLEAPGERTLVTLSSQRKLGSMSPTLLLSPHCAERPQETAA